MLLYSFYFHHPHHLSVELVQGSLLFSFVPNQIQMDKSINHKQWLCHWRSSLYTIILVYLSILLEKLLTLSMYALPGTTLNLDSCTCLFNTHVQGGMHSHFGSARVLQLCHARDTRFGIHYLATRIFIIRKTGGQLES